MTASFQIILKDLSNFEPETPTLPEKPYTSDDEYRDQVRKCYLKLQRASSRNRRQKALFYAYCLGEVIENLESRSKRNKAKQLVTKHYYTVARRTYHIFAMDPAQIYRTGNMTTVDVVHLLSAEYESLVTDDDDVLPGGSN
jgi:hypothetical protein